MRPFVLLAVSSVLLASRSEAQTFAKDVAPIVFEACGSCHRPGGPGPFPLTTYDEVRRRATQIAQVTSSRFMPPWKADAGGGHFVGQRRLTDREIASIEHWASNGAPEGDPRNAASRPSDADGWQLGTPDLIVKPAARTRCRRNRPTCSASSRFRLPVDGVRYVAGSNSFPATRASSITPTSGSIIRRRRAGWTPPIRCPATTA